MRIIAGRYRGARLGAPPGLRVRPSAARTREALFNLVQGGRYGDPLTGRPVVDGFAGSGALGLEALSRGAASVLFIERDRAALAALRRNIAALGAEAGTAIAATDAARFARPAPAPAGLVLLDPPYGSGLAGPLLARLRDTGWIGPDTLILVETAAAEVPDPGPGFESAERRRYGAARLSVLRAAAGAP